MARQKQRTISEADRKAKSEKIKNSKRETALRRADMHPVTYHIKITSGKLSNRQKESLFRLFLEAKWLRNAAIANNINSIHYAKDCKYKVDVKVGDSYEVRDLKNLGSQLSQAVIQELNANKSALKALKANGHKVGKINYSKEVTAIGLNQFGITYKLDFEKNKVHIQGIGWLHARGLDQLSPDGDFASAKLLAKPDGYYVAVTCYEYPNSGGSNSSRDIGIDINVGRPIVLSNRREIAAYFEESDRLKGLQCKLARQEKGSNRYVKTCKLIQREHQKIENKKDDMARKAVAYLLDNFQTIYFQDENISSWKRFFSGTKGARKIQHGILGRVKELLKEAMKHTPRIVMLDKWVPTTAWCRMCHQKTPHGLSKRSYECAHCGWTHPDRDVASAENMILIGKMLDTYLNPPVGHRGTLVEGLTTA